MKYVALLRGINVGGNHKVEMKRLKEIFEACGYTEVSTYINSGNVMFQSSSKKEVVVKKVEEALAKNFAFKIPTLVKSGQEIVKITEAIPGNWLNDKDQRTDVAYLFPEIDDLRFVDELPVKREHIDICYTRGAMYWNIKRENVNKSNLAKLVGHKLYKLMTIRNVNTARYLTRMVRESN